MEDYFYLALCFFLSISIAGIYLTPNPIYSIMFLVWCIILSSLLLLFLGEEFVGLILLVIYVGAVAILFLFVVMLLGTRLADISLAIVPIWFNALVIVASTLVLVFSFFVPEGFSFFQRDTCHCIFVDNSFFLNDFNNLVMLAYEIISSPTLILAALILLVAMLTAISLAIWR